MRVALLERFGEPTRAVDVGILEAAGDDVVVWDLAWSGDRPPTVREVVRALPGWLAMPAPWRWRIRLARSAWETTSHRRALLARLPGWVRRLRARDVDEIVCFSAAELPVAAVLASETARPVRELGESGTRYLGEFAFEQFAVIPYAYWLHQEGRLQFTVSTADTRAFYYFSPNHTEVPVARRYLPATEYPASAGADLSRAETIPGVLDTTQWQAPPYRDVYGGDPRFAWPKPAVVICNKTNPEDYLGGGGRAVNSLDTDLVLALVGMLRDRYTVIYNRPREADIVGDHDAHVELGDIEALDARDDVITIQQIHARHPDLSFNELQLRVFASAERFISVLGGSSYLASYFGGTNVVYAVAGQEVDCGAFTGWFHEFSGARVIAVDTPRALLDAVDLVFGRSSS